MTTMANNGNEELDSTVGLAAEEDPSMALTQVELDRARAIKRAVQNEHPSIQLSDF